MRGSPTAEGHLAVRGRPCSRCADAAARRLGGLSSLGFCAFKGDVLPALRARQRSSMSPTIIPGPADHGADRFVYADRIHRVGCGAPAGSDPSALRMAFPPYRVRPGERASDRERTRELQRTASRLWSDALACASRLRPMRSWLFTQFPARTAEVREISPARVVPAQISASFLAFPVP